jgi:hypothetical protein
MCRLNYEWVSAQPAVNCYFFGIEKPLRDLNGFSILMHISRDVDILFELL